MSRNRKRVVVSPGKTRTWWHPLFVQVLVFELAESAEVRGEVLVGKMPMRLDVLIARRLDQLPVRAKRDMPVLATFLNRITQVQYKGPTDVVEPGDLPQFEGVALLWFGQEPPLVTPKEVTLLLIAPRVTDRVIRDCARLGYVLQPVEVGVYEIRDRAFPMFVLEADALAEQDPVLALFSTAPLKRRDHIVERLEASGHSDLLLFLLQQVQQLRRMGDDVMKTQFKDLKDMDRFEAEVLAAIPVEKRLRGVPLKERLRGVTDEQLEAQVLAAIPVEKRLRGVPVEDRLRDVPVEDRLRDVPVEDRLRAVTAKELLAAKRSGKVSQGEIDRLKKLLAELEGPDRSGKKRRRR